MHRGVGKSQRGAAAAAERAPPVADRAAEGEGSGDAGQTDGRVPVLLPQHGASAQL